MRVAVLGGGYAGVAVARILDRSLDDDVELVVVDDTGTHLVQHELHRVIRRPSLVDHLQIPLGDLLGDAAVLQGRVVDVDPDEGVVTFAEGDALTYDAGAVCLGAETAFHGLDDVREHATPLKSVADAEAIREGFHAVCDDDGRVVVGGAGLSGVQVAGELAAIADERGAAPTITLVEQADRVAPQQPPDFARAVRDALQFRGVEVRTGAEVTGADAGAVALADGAALDCDQFVWAGGIEGPSAVGGERPVVDADLRLGERTVGLGDAVRVVDGNGETVPASAQAAVRQATVAAENVERLLEGGDGVFAPRLERFTFESPGWLVSVGDGAVGQVGPTVLTGAAARTLKASVGATYFGSVGAVERATDVVYEELGLGEAGDDPAVGDGDAEEGAG